MLRSHSSGNLQSVSHPDKKCGLSDLPLEVGVMIMEALIKPYYLRVVLRPRTGRVIILPKIYYANDAELNPGRSAEDLVLSKDLLTVSKWFLLALTGAFRSRFTGKLSIDYDTFNLIRLHCPYSSLTWNPGLVTEIYHHGFKKTDPFNLDFHLYPNLKVLHVGIGLREYHQELQSRLYDHWNSMIASQTWKTALDDEGWRQLSDISSLFHPETSYVKVTATVDLYVYNYRREFHLGSVQLEISQKGNLIVLRSEMGLQHTDWHWR